MVEIIAYQDHFQPEFKKLNLEWLDRYHLTESHDLLLLDDPKGNIIDKGGYIWLARSGNEIVGTAALIKEHDGVFELAKMSVTKNWQGKGISKRLLETCISAARQNGGKKMTLYSNHQLQTALKLYEKYGFRQVEVKDSPFETADVKMELNLLPEN